MQAAVCLVRGVPPSPSPDVAARAGGNGEPAQVATPVTTHVVVGEVHAWSPSAGVTGQPRLRLAEPTAV